MAPTATTNGNGVVAHIQSKAELVTSSVTSFAQSTAAAVSATVQAPSVSSSEAIEKEHEYGAHK